MSNLRIVAADEIKGSGLDLLKREFGEGAIEVRGKFSEAELCEKIGAMDALLIRSGTNVTATALEKAGARLKLIGRAGVGTDNIDKKTATAKGIVVMNTPFGNTTSAAEQAIAMLFAVARNTARADKLMHEGKWEKKDLVGAEVYQKILGLIGMGRIGSHVAKVMAAAGMKVIAYDPFLSADRARQIGVTLVTLDELAQKADFISVHTPLTEQTRHLISTDYLAKMKKGVRIVNCARGNIVDETVLAEAVKSGQIAGAGLDVFAQEPLEQKSPLIGVKNILLTPHLGASTEEAEERCGLQMAEQVVAYFQRGEIINAVNLTITREKGLSAYVELARRLGKIAATLLRGAPTAIEVSCAGGLFAGKDVGELSAAALIGVLENFGIDGLNIINIANLAHERGVKISNTVSAECSVYANRVDVTLHSEETKCTVGGTVSGTTIFRIIRLDDAEIDTRIGKHLLLLRYPDKPGYVGKVGTMIGAAGINIEHMEVGALESKKRATMVVGIDQRVPEALLRDLLSVDGMEKAFYCEL